jgi:hypothetical protein
MEVAMADDQPPASPPSITIDELASEMLGGLVGASIGAALSAFAAIKESTGAEPSAEVRQKIATVVLVSVTSGLRNARLKRAFEKAYASFLASRL